MTSLPFEKMPDDQPAIYCVIDRQGRFLHVAQSVSDMLGYGPGELIGRPFMDFVYDEDKEATLAILEELYRGQFVRRFINRYYHKGGDLVAIQWSSQWDPEEQLLYCLGNGENIDVDLEQLQQQFNRLIKQFNTKLSETIERVTDGVCSLDKDWRFTYVNHAALSILRMSITDLLGQVIWDVFPEAIGSVFEQEYKRCYAQQIPVFFETFYPAPLNMVFEVRAYPSSTGISIFFNDITQKKQVHEEMRKLSLMIKHTDNIVLLCDTDGRIKWVNDAFVRKTGYTLDEAEGKRPGDMLMGPGTDQQVIDRLRAQYQRGEHFHAELLFYTKYQEKLWVDVTGQMIHDEKGKIKELFSIQTDITEKKLLEERLTQEREQRQRQITAAVIQAQELERSEIGKELHDNINQLLTTAKLYLEVSQEPIMKGEELIKKSIGTLQQAIEEIRSLSRQLSAPAVEHVTLAESISGLCEKVADCSQFNVRLDCSGIDGLEVSEELHLAVYRILQEQLTNILKHADAANVMVKLYQEEGLLVMKVSDDGKGFVTKGKRSGIGITNMKTRAESLNGTFLISSAPGKGCLLIVCLPLQY